MRAARWTIVVVLTVLGCQAFYGGFRLIQDGFGLPVSWLDPLPLDSWLIPGLLLMLLVGVPAFGVLGLQVAGNAGADRWTLVYGLGLMLWIGVQVLIVPFFFLQPVVFLLGALLALLAWFRLRRAAA